MAALSVLGDDGEVSGDASVVRHQPQETHREEASLTAATVTGSVDTPAVLTTCPLNAGTDDTFSGADAGQLGGLGALEVCSAHKEVI